MNNKTEVKGKSLFAGLILNKKEWPLKKKLNWIKIYKMMIKKLFKLANKI